MCFYEAPFAPQSSAKYIQKLLNTSILLKYLKISIELYLTVEENIHSTKIYQFLFTITLMYSLGR